MRPAPFLPIFHFLSSIFLAACGAPGEPSPPAPVVPAVVADLTARQDGDGVQLSFMLPTSAIGGGKLTSSPAVEIVRGALQPNGAPDYKTFRVVDTIPGALVDNYRSEGGVRFTDPIAPEETKAHPGGTVAYLVRTRASQKRASADSNVVSVRVFPVPERIASVEAHVTESAIELSWQVPTRTSAGDPLSAVTSYRIYRSELSTTAAPSSAQAVGLSSTLEGSAGATGQNPLWQSATTGAISYLRALATFAGFARCGTLARIPLCLGLRPQTCHGRGQIRPRRKRRCRAESS